MLAIVALSAGIIVMRRHPEPRINSAAAVPIAQPVWQGADANLTGRVEPRTTVTVGAPLPGVLEAYFVDLNQEVYQGQLLGRIRNPQLEAAEQRVQSELEKLQERAAGLNAEAISARMEVSRASADQIRARSEKDRLEKLFQRQQVLMDAGATPRLTFEKSEKDYSAAKTEFETLDAVAKNAGERVASVTRDLAITERALAEKTDALQQAKTALSAREMHAPADGVVIARRGQPGDPVDPSMKDLFEIATGLMSMQVVATPEAPVLARLHAGQAATVRLPGATGEELPGTVRELRGGQVIVDFTSPAPVTRIGVTAQVKIKL